MNSFFVTFHTLTQAQKMRKSLQARGIRSTLTRTPKAISEGGCGYGLRLQEREFPSARPYLHGYSRVFFGQGSDWQALVP